MKRSIPGMSALTAEFGASLQRGTALCACSGNKRRTALLAETCARGIQHPAIWAANSPIIPTRRHPIAIATAMGTVVTVMMPPMMASTIMSTTVMSTTVMISKYSVQETHANSPFTV